MTRNGFRRGQYAGIVLLISLFVGETGCATSSKQTEPLAGHITDENPAGLTRLSAEPESQREAHRTAVAKVSGQTDIRKSAPSETSRPAAGDHGSSEIPHFPLTKADVSERQAAFTVREGIRPSGENSSRLRLVGVEEPGSEEGERSEDEENGAGEESDGEDRNGDETAGNGEGDDPESVVAPPNGLNGAIVPDPLEDFSDDADILVLEEVIASVYRAYPLLHAALFQRNVAEGQIITARGAFDLLITGESRNQPLGFYQTYRQNIGFSQPTMWGGEIFGGYRIGRGSFEPWYRERQTNDGGEFRAGIAVPLARNIDIDPRRAELARTSLERQLVEFDIRAQQIEFVQLASIVYWEWVAAGRRREIAASILSIAEERNAGIRRQVEVGDLDPPVLQDNQRLIVSRQANLISAERELEQASIQLSLFFRDEQGEPIVLGADRLPRFPMPSQVHSEQMDNDIHLALANRPGLQVLDFQQQQLQVDYEEARNDTFPDVTAALYGSQDVGAPTSPKRDKSQFEMEASVFLNVPVQRRAARGRMASIEGRMAQLSAHRRLAEDRVVTDVQNAYAALIAAFERTERAREAAELADILAANERRLFEVGASNLLSVNLREEQAAEAGLVEVTALLEYFIARANYQAALALD